MTRYSNIGTKITEDGKKVLKPTLYPTIPRDSNDIYILTSVGDRLDLLAFKYYNSVDSWWIIAQANGLGKGSLNIPPGLTVRIPTNLQAITAAFNALNK